MDTASSGVLLGASGICIGDGSGILATDHPNADGCSGVNCGSGISIDVILAGVGLCDLRFTGLTDIFGFGTFREIADSISSRLGALYAVGQ